MFKNILNFSQKNLVISKYPPIFNTLFQKRHFLLTIKINKYHDKDNFI